MCVIVALANGQKLPENKLKNAALNNPHGFGLVTVHNSKIEVFHKFDERGNNPEVVARELEKRANADWNYLHLRYSTRGSKSKENCHPFTVFKTKERRVEFMHNGSFNNRHTNAGTHGDKSDSRIFAENYLAPLLERFRGDNGQADIEDVFLEHLIDEYFNYSNRGVLIANDLEAMFLGKWDTTLGDTSDKIVVSNTDYFLTSQTHRMTEFYKPKMEYVPSFLQRQATVPSNDDDDLGDQAHYPLGTAGTVPVKTGPAPTEETTVIQSTTTPTTKATGSTAEGKGLHEGSSTTKTEFKGRKIIGIKEIDLRKSGRFLQASDIDGLFDVTAGELDDELIAYIAMLSLTEFRSYVDVNPDGASRLLEHIFLKAQSLIEDNDELADKHLRATARIANLVSSARAAGVTVSDYSE